MSWIAVGVAGTTAAIGGIQYIASKRNAKKDEQNRPQYEIPAEIGQNLNQAQANALQGLPEEQKQQYLNNIQRSAGYGLSQIGSRKGGLAGVATANQQQNDAYGNLLSMDAQARMANQDKLMGARQTMADYRDQAFQVNKENPYYENIAKRDARNGALAQNLTNAVGLGASMYGMAKNQTTNPATTGYGQPNVNPYATYNNPNTQNMFVSPKQYPYNY